MKKVSKHDYPLISVIIPVYNSEKYLKRCIDSVINQSYKNLEIIIVNDGSTDNSLNICKEYKKLDNRIILIDKKNGGVSVARNAGIKVSKGELISFVDSDDWIARDFLKVLYDNMNEYNADISGCEIEETSSHNIKNVNDEIKKIIKYSQFEYMKLFFKINSQKCVYYVCNKLYKRNLICDNSFPKNIAIGEDVLANYGYYTKAHIIVECNLKLYFYFRGDDCTTKKPFTEKDMDLIYVWNKIVDDSKGIYHNYAILNRKRINFTLLFRIAKLNDYSKYSVYVSTLIDDLKKDFNDLLVSKIPFSRKIAIIWMVINYSSFSFVVRNFIRKRS